MTWQPDGWNDDMSEAPKDGTRILFWQAGKKIKMGEWLPPEANWTVYGWKCTHGNLHDPTHWRYLPSPPSKQED